MMPSTIAALLAADRRQTLLREAEVHRRVSELRAARRPESRRRTAASVLQRVVSRMTPVRIRPVRRADAMLLANGFARLSDESRRLRFLSPKSELSAAELRYFTDVDHHDHEALVAVSMFGRRGFGVARYVRHHDDPAAADIAVTVVDAWQGRGLGTKLVARLTERARCEGIRRFTALLATDNARVRRLLERSVAPVSLVERAAGTLAYEIDLTPVRRGRPHLLRVAARSATGCAGAS